MSRPSISPSEQAEAFSSRDRPSQAVAEDDTEADEAVFAADPLDGTVLESTPFKRKQKASSTFSVHSFLSSKNRTQPPTLGSSNARARRLHTPTTPSSSTEPLPPYLDGPSPGAQPNNPKGTTGSDWYAESLGRRVRYDNLTAIDWIYEYAKERQRLKVLRSSTEGLIGHVRQLADASQIWWVLIATGVAAGVLAAGIDVVSDWLADLKTGFCGNIFYLNKGFCCWGYDEFAQCQDWSSWSTVLGVSSKASSWIIEYIFFIVSSVLFAACASFLVKSYAIYAKQSGIPEIKTVLGGFVIRRFMGTWTLVVKSLGLCLAVASGLWLGKEGPLVHVACCCANLFMKAFDNLNSNEARKREVLSAAAAAGISVAFGSPIGGVLFSLEQLSYYFPDKTMWQSFVCAMVAAVSLQALNPFRTGKLVLYQVTYHTGWHGFELVPFAILGILGGLYGGLFIKLNKRIAEWRRNSVFNKNTVLEVILITFITALINFPIKFMRVQSSELVYTLFAECVDLTEDQLGLCKSGKANTGVVTLLLISAVLGFFLATATFGLQIPAGILLPSMAIGALYGRAVGLILEVWQRAYPNFVAFASCEPDVPCITPGTYAIIGAASALAGATRMTVSIVVIMFELTGALTYVLPIMIAVMISKWVGDAISPQGIYESWIHLNGYPFLENRDDNSAAVPDVPAAQVMTRIEDLVVMTATGHTIRSLRSLLKAQPFRGFPVIENSREAVLLGYISRTELEFALRSALSAPRSLPLDTEACFLHRPLNSPGTSLDLRPWMDQTPITLNVKAALGLTVSMFQRLGLRYVIFVEKGALKGLLTKKDVWYVLNGVEAGKAKIGAGRGVLREERGLEAERGLLGARDGDGEEESREGFG